MRRRLIRWLKTGGIVLCILLIAFCAYHLTRELSEYAETDAVYRAVEESVISTQTGRQDSYKPPKPPIQEEGGVIVEPTEPPEQLVEIPEVDFDALQEINIQGIGWIYQPGTIINYPIAQATDNSYYLRHNINGRESGAGAIFLDYRNAEDFSDRVSVLYGHHMQRGTMFASIDKYRKQDYYDKHPIAYLIAPTGCWRIEFFAGSVHTAEEVPLEFEDEAAYMQHIAELIADSTFISYVPVTEKNWIIALSTCAYDFRNARFILYGVLKRVW